MLDTELGGRTGTLARRPATPAAALLRPRTAWRMVDGAIPGGAKGGGTEASVIRAGPGQMSVVIDPEDSRV